MICDKNYYNSTCTVLCKPRNDQFGHYTCNSKGQKVCLEGWSGETCDKPLCPEGCVHGMCKSPGKIFGNARCKKPQNQFKINIFFCNAQVSVNVGMDIKVRDATNV